MLDLAQHIRTIPDFPSPGIQFLDLTPLLGSAGAMAQAADALVAERFASATVVAGIEARGFWFGPLVAQKLGVGFVPIRKPGKLPGPTLGIDYDLEYGTDRLEVHADAFGPADHVLLIDDVLATGGTLAAAAALVAEAGANVLGASVLLSIAALNGRDQLGSMDLHAVMEA